MNNAVHYPVILCMLDWLDETLNRCVYDNIAYVLDLIRLSLSEISLPLIFGVSVGSELAQ